MQNLVLGVQVLESQRTLQTSSRCLYVAARAVQVAC